MIIRVPDVCLVRVFLVRRLLLMYLAPSRDSPIMNQISVCLPTIRRPAEPRLGHTKPWWGVPKHIRFVGKRADSELGPILKLSSRVRLETPSHRVMFAPRFFPSPEIPRFDMSCSERQTRVSSVIWSTESLDWNARAVPTQQRIFIKWDWKPFDGAAVTTSLQHNF